MTTCDLYIILHEELGRPSSDLVTRQSGQAVRERIEQALLNEKDRAVIALDFSRIGVIDYSCADEIIAKIISRLLGGEYGDRYILLCGITDNQKENIEVALERKDLAIVADMRGGKKTILGSLNNYLRETLRLITEQGRLTARDLADLAGIGANTSGTRLLNLHKKRLVMRTEEQGESGRVWVYTVI
ncbi:MAG: hypothetical protein JSU90_08295 [Nitrospiraceae bacterium]|nr:MAG: hypothetical protein JSU90_08295 [Nitrospiraceae bacterium]